MIINTGARTDTVQYFSEWMLNRFREGYVLVRNPMFPNNVTRYVLTPDKVDCVVFCSKNYAPILDRLHEITDRFNTYFQYTITAYGRDVEPGVPSIDESIDTLKELSTMVGKERVAWRYDPILLTDRYTKEVHRKTFSRMAEEMAPYVGMCIFSFVDMYRKLDVNMPEIIPMTQTDKDNIANMLSVIAKRNDLRIQTCGESGDYSRFGIGASGCLTADILGRANGIVFRDIRHKGMRKGCRCIESRDIGAYDTCPNGCRYCYANASPEIARRNYAGYDPDSPLLLSSISDDDVITDARQESFLVKRRTKDITEF